MWNKGTLEIKTTDGTKAACRYCIKHFDEPSETYGIDGGRISKMEIRMDNKVTLNYDRGWDKKPEDEATKLAYSTLLAKFN